MKAVFPDNFAVSQNPIFIVGFPRSGTTLLQALLATQESICSFPETQFFFYIQRLLQLDAQGHIERGCLVQVFRAVQGLMDLEFPPDVAARIERAAEEGRLDVKSLFELIIWQFVGKEPATGNLAEMRWVEKSPYHAMFLSQISALYPRALFLHITRNPVYAVSSARTKPFANGQSISSLAATWNAFMDAVEQFRREHPEKILTLKYEELAAGPQQTMAAVCDFIGLALDSERLARYRVASEKIVLPFESWKSGVSEEITDTSARYRNRISQLEILRIQNIAGVHMQRFRYPLEYPRRQALFDFAFTRLGGFLPEEFKPEPIAAWLGERAIPSTANVAV